jgi:transcriptional regulator with XRE-family HTH domain
MKKSHEGQSESMLQALLRNVAKAEYGGQKGFASACGISVTTLNKVMAGHVAPSLGLMERFAAVTQQPVESLHTLDGMSLFDVIPVVLENAPKRERKVSSAYLLAETLFHGYSGETGMLSPAEIRAAGAQMQPGRTGVEGVEIYGYEGRIPCTERLSLGKNDQYRYAKTYAYGRRRAEQAIISSTQERGLRALENSFLLETLVNTVEQQRIGEQSATEAS